MLNQVSEIAKLPLVGQFKLISIKDETQGIKCLLPTAVDVEVGDDDILCRSIRNIAKIVYNASRPVIWKTFCWLARKDVNDTAKISAARK